MGIYQGPGSYSWTNFDKYLTSIVAAGMRPIMEMDFMPTALALNGSDKDIYKSVDRLQERSSPPSSSTAWTSTA